MKPSDWIIERAKECNRCGSEQAHECRECGRDFSEKWCIEHEGLCVDCFDDEQWDLTH